MKGLSKSSIIAAALASFLSPDSADQREAAIGKRLDRLTRQFDKLERDQNILIETLALFIRYYLSVTPAVPEAHQEAARAQGQARFEQFVQQLGPASAARQQPGARGARRNLPRPEPILRLRRRTGRGRGNNAMSAAAATVLCATAGERRTRMLRTAMGPAIAAALEDPEVVEILLNPDGSLWSIGSAADARRPACRSRRTTPSASSVWSPRTSAPKFMPASRSCRPSCR